MLTSVPAAEARRLRSPTRHRCHSSRGNGPTNSSVTSAASPTSGASRSRIVADNIQVQIALLFAAALCHDLIYYLGTSAIGLVDLPYFWLRYGLGRAVYTALLGTLISAGLTFRRHLFPA